MGKLSQGQHLSRQLSPKQIIQTKLLQFNLFDLEQYIINELQENIALDIDDENIIDNDKVDEPLLDSIADNKEDDLGSKEEDGFDWDELMDEPEEYKSDKTIKKDFEVQDEALKHENSTIFSNIIEQLTDDNESSKGLLIAEEILGNVDDDGYLTIETILIADRLQVAEDQVVSVLQKIQSCTPPGIGARNIQECILAQLKYHNASELSIHIVQDYFDDFVNHRYERIIKKIKCVKDDFNEAIEIISHVNPKPGYGSFHPKQVTIIPDIIVEHHEGKWHIALNDSFLPSLRISKKYISLFEKSTNDKKTKTFIKDKLSKAQWFIDGIQDRKKTIHAVMDSIIKFQPHYFKLDDRRLTPMKMEEIAQDVNIDISTVSRTVNRKYVQMPWGIKELRYFFSEGVFDENQKKVSNKEVKKIIHQIIENEDKLSPLNDMKIANELKEKGIIVARRTVTKYREALKIPAARLRRKI